MAGGKWARQAGPPTHGVGERHGMDRTTSAGQHVESCIKMNSGQCEI